MTCCSTCFPGPCNQRCATKPILTATDRLFGVIAECRAAIASLEEVVERQRARLSALDRHAWNEGALTSRVELLEAQLREMESQR